MTKSQQNKLSMYLAVQTFFAANTVSLASITALQPLLQKLNDLITNIQETERRIGEAVAGKTKEKANAEKEVIVVTSVVSSSLNSFATTTGNASLAQQTHFTKSKLRQLRDNALSETAQNIHRLAQTHAQDLAGYGITPEKIAEIPTKVQAFNTAIGEMETAKAEKKALHKIQRDNFKSTDNLLKKEIDKLMNIFESTNEELFLSYKALRVIKDLG